MMFLKVYLTLKGLKVDIAHQSSSGRVQHGDSYFTKCFDRTPVPDCQLSSAIKPNKHAKVDFILVADFINM